jgi:hypothetical protein
MRLSAPAFSNAYLGNPDAQHRASACMQELADHIPAMVSPRPDPSSQHMVHRSARA